MKTDCKFQSSFQTVHLRRRACDVGTVESKFDVTPRLFATAVSVSFIAAVSRCVETRYLTYSLS
jgi:hypothetical protein